VKHLRAYFGRRKLASITAQDVTQYIVKRQADTKLVRKAQKERLHKLRGGKSVTLPETTL